MLKQIEETWDKTDIFFDFLHIHSWDPILLSKLCVSVLLGMQSYLFSWMSLVLLYVSITCEPLLRSDWRICQLQGVLFFDRMTDDVLDTIREELEVSKTVAGQSLKLW